MDVRNIIRIGVSTHSRLKAAAVDGVRKRFSREVSTHSRLKAAVACQHRRIARRQFQHTAA